MIKLGIVMDPIATINIKKDTSFAMLLEAQRRGYELHYMEMNDLYLINGEARARTRKLSVEQNYDKWYEFTAEQDLPLADLDVILMRKDPPFDTEFIYATYILNNTIIYPYPFIAKSPYCISIMRYKKYCCSTFHHFFHFIHTFYLKSCISNRKSFIYNQYLWFNIYCNCKCQSGKHSRRICLYRLIYKFTNICKF